MKENFATALAAVLKHEGGWSDHPADPGGATMRGVTKRTLEAHLGREMTKEELRNISDAMLSEIYRRRYWNAVRGDELPAGAEADGGVARDRDVRVADCDARAGHADGDAG